MANRFYVSDASRSRRVHDLFSGIATRYDLINDLQSFGLHRWWKRRLLRWARVEPGDRALDVCCGTGDLAFLLADRGARVVGVDFCWPMLSRAVDRAAGRAGRAGGGDRPVRFVAGDGCRLPLGDGTVDLITIGYGLRNLPDIPQALVEFYRVARPGGRLLVLDFGKPENRLWGGCYAMYLGVCVPLYGRWFHGDPSTYDYIRESLEHYPAQAGVTTAAAAAGWGTVECRNLLGGIMSIHRAIKPGGRGTASSAGG